MVLIQVNKLQDFFLDYEIFIAFGSEKTSPEDFHVSADGQSLITLLYGYVLFSV